jgi:chromosome segregation ATPase
MAEAECLRSSDTSTQGTLKSAKGEERISLFWRVFGGTLLSIAALVCITVYQQLTSTLGELRTNMNHLTESRAELVKNDEFNNRMTSVWSSIKELQSANATLSGLKERSALLEQQVRTGQDQVNSQLTSVCTALKDLEVPRESISALKERLALLEQQVKAGEDERKELVRELQRLRERQAVLEGRQTVGAAGAPNGHEVK